MSVFLLNPQQQEAVKTIDGPLLILAGAGTGKTRVIVQRIGEMLHRGIPADCILAVTFTNKAAREMRERVLALDGVHPGDSPTVSTFHSFCIGVLRQHAPLIGFSKNFSLATEGYQKGLLREISIELKLDKDGIDPYTWLAKIGLAKAAMQTPQAMAESGFPDAERIAAIYKRYQERLRRMNMMDFDDILGMTVELWNTRPDVLDAYRERFRFLMIDEYQDTNKVQLHIMAMLAGRTHNICAVGDDDQSIYEWRGASQENILEFETFFPGAKVIRLEQNYRSTNGILKAANALISKNTARREKNLWSNQGDGEKLTGVRCEDEHKEADYIADTVYNMSMRGNSLLTQNRDWRRFAVLYRTSGQSRLLEEAFRRRRIPFVVVGSKSFYQRKEILDIITLLELVVNPNNDMGLQRVINVPPRGIGDATLDKLAELRDITHANMLSLLSYPSFTETLPPETAGNVTAFLEAINRCADGVEKKGPIYGRVSRLLQDIDYINKLIQMYKPRSDALVRKDNVIEFLTSISEFDDEHDGQGTLTEYLEKIALQDANDRLDKDKNVDENAVNFMTIHASKGLEFPVVFVVGMEQGLFPHQMAMDEGKIEEERRLCYVAMTRAREKLILTYSDKRKVMNKLTIKRPSMFLDEIPGEFIDYKVPGQDFAASAEQSLDFISQIKERMRKGMSEHSATP